METKDQAQPYGVTPWFKVWIAPRSIIREFLDSPFPEKNARLLAALAGIITSIEQLEKDSLTASNVIINIIVGAIMGIIALYLFGFILRVTGSWFGGEGDAEDLRTAVTRGQNVLTILLAVFWIPKLLLFGLDAFSSMFWSIDITNIPKMILFIFEIPLSIWSFVVFVLSVAEAHRFSGWRSLGACLISAFFVLLLFLVILLPFLALSF
ncbi:MULTISPECIES: YIP1 family protein [Bacillus]|uniref:Yip1 domain-containing protein n=2 Tax=Bacillus TaxID=1386 RepID=A0A0M4FLC1_9BACI|nr:MULTISPECIES: YIP1 family protein [Bacillus]ALC82791.1 hypothetical protein AM592_15265 [Bacillus gobiensis]MBP1081751.1 hypothetical protein [Bacillus capparidis]MED1096403.1 YIP1 family protein [Bacillus capparidis]